MELVEEVPAVMLGDTEEAPRNAGESAGVVLPH
jgi:hypothetical protein